MKLLNDVLPYRMSNGFCFDQFSDNCLDCGKDIPQEAWNGALNLFGTSVLFVDLETNCPHCQAHNERRLRFGAVSPNAALVECYDAVTKTWERFGLVGNSRKPSRLPAALSFLTGRGRATATRPEKSEA